MKNLVNEARNYIDQLIHVKSDTKSRVAEVIKEFVEFPGDDTNSYWEYTCLDKDGEFVISFAVNINEYVELIDENECY